MKSRVHNLIYLVCFISIQANAQVSFKTEYFGKSAYMEDISNEEAPLKIGDGTGSTIVYSGNITIPFFEKLNEENRPTSFGVSISGAYASLDNKLENKTIPVDLVKDIMNIQVGFYYLRPLNDKWSLLGSIGAGTYVPSNQLSDISHKNILGSIGAIFIKHINPNLDLGAGVTVNSTFGYPMAFPALYLNWTLNEKLKVKASLGEGVELLAGYNFSDYFSLSLVAELNGQMALVEKNGEDKIFTHQYITSGLRPEINFPKMGISIPFTFGISAYRPAFYSDRTLKAMFSTDNDYYFFNASLYASASIKYTF